MIYYSKNKVELNQLLIFEALHYSLGSVMTLGDIFLGDKKLGDNDIR